MATTKKKSELVELRPNGKVRLNFHPGQTRTWESQARFVFMLAGTQGGKSLALNTPIPTPSGYKDMGDLCIGDTVYDEAGRRCRVTYATDAMYDHTCYRVMFHDGSSIVADAEHLWSVRCAAGIEQVLTTEQIRAAFDRGYTIPLVSSPRWRAFRTITPVSSVPVRCIQVDSPSHLYVAGRQDIVTHNTSFGPWWMHREIFDPIIGKGAGDYIAATSTYDLFKLKMLPEMLRVFEEILGIGRFWPGDKVLELKDPETDQFWAKRSSDRMWARIILRAASSGSGLESTTAKAAWLDEVGQEKFLLTAWEAILRRLSLEEGRVLGTTTLYSTGWLKQQVYDEWVKGDPEYECIQFASYINPLFSRKEYETRKSKMPEWKFRMFYKGEFTKPAGLIYSDYDEDIHKVPRFPIPDHWPRYVGIDPGGVNLATIWLAHDQTHNLFYAYRSTLEGNMTTNEHVAKALERAGNENVVLWTGGAGSEEQVRRDWNEAGFFVQKPAVADVEAGIDRVIELFKTRRLYIFDDLQGLRDELGSYSRELDSSYEPTDKIKDKNTFHILDSLRYVASRLPQADAKDIDLAGVAENQWEFINGVTGPQVGPHSTSPRDHVPEGVKW